MVKEAAVEGDGKTAKAEEASSGKSEPAKEKTKKIVSKKSETPRTDAQTSEGSVAEAAPVKKEPKKKDVVEPAVDGAAEKTKAEKKEEAKPADAKPTKAAAAGDPGTAAAPVKKSSKKAEAAAAGPVDTSEAKLPKESKTADATSQPAAAETKPAKVKKAVEPAATAGVEPEVAPHKELAGSSQPEAAAADPATKPKKKKVTQPVDGAAPPPADVETAAATTKTGEDVKSAEKPAKKKDKAAAAAAAAATAGSDDGNIKDAGDDKAGEATATADGGDGDKAKKKSGEGKKGGKAEAAAAAAGAAASVALGSFRKGLHTLSQGVAAAAARLERAPILIEDSRGRTTVELELKALKDAVEAVEGERDSMVAVVRKLEAAVMEHEQTAARLSKEIKSIKRWSFGGVNKACAPLEVKLTVAQGEKEVMTAELEEFCQVVYKLEAELVSMRGTSVKLEEELKRCR